MVCGFLADLRPQGPRQPVEVVAVRALEEELSIIAGSREKVLGHSKEPLPAVGSRQCMQWYGDLVSIIDQEALLFNQSSLDCWVVEFALPPPAAEAEATQLAQTIQSHLGRPLSSVPEIWSLRDLVPRQVNRIFAWPGECNLRLARRKVLKANPNLPGGITEMASESLTQ